jgi:release factor glutamine methyltransferase
MPQPTLQEILAKAVELLESKSIGEPKRSAELLLCHALSCRRIDLYLNFDKPLVEPDLEAFRVLLRRRLKHEPVQYITGETEFYGIPLHVNPDVLIPRPETELLVDEALRLVKTLDRPAVMLDIGSGSGAIPIALARHLPEASCDAMEVSGAAIEVARGNAERNGVASRVRFFKADILDDAALDLLGEYDLLLSNPPYIRREEMDGLQPEVRDHEPRLATTDEGDGLTFYRRIAAIQDRLLKPGAHALVEIAFGQARDVADIFTSSGLELLRIVKDYSGIERVVVGKRAVGS